MSVIFLSLISSCEDPAPESTIPFVYVREEINPTSIQYKELWNIGGFVILEDAGYNDIMVYRESSNTYRAFEMTCTYDPKDPCSDLVMDDSNLFMIDKCCNSTYNLNGIPTGGPAFRALVEYKTRMEGNILIIFNQ